MEINNKSVRGIYLYNNLVTYEPGDFVVLNNTIYVCINKCSCKDPSTERKYYQIYLGETIATDEDFELFRSSHGDDKYLSAYYLGKILNSYMAGFSEKGVINNYVDSAGSIFVKDYFGNPSGVTVNDSSEYIYPLDKIMVTEDLNNAIFSVNRSVVEYIGIPSGKTGSVILRQYTFEESSDSGLYTRVQELVDEEYGLIRFRYSSSLDQYEPSNPWVLTTVNNEFRTIVTELINYYSSKIIEIDKMEASIRDSFRFKSIPVNYTSSINYNGDNTLTVSSGTKTSPMPYLGSGDFFITICLKYSELTYDGTDDTIWRTDSLTINMADVTTTTTFGVVGNRILSITKSTGSYTFTVGGGCFVYSMYYRQSLDESITVSDNISEKHALTTVQTSETGAIEFIPAEVVDQATGLTINLGTLKPAGCDFLARVSVKNYNYNLTTNSWEIVLNYFDIKFSIGSEWIDSGTLYTSNNKTLCRINYSCDYNVPRGKVIFSVTPNINGSSGQDIGGLLKTSTRPTSPPTEYLTNPMSIVKLYYIA